MQEHLAAAEPTTPTTGEFDTTTEADLEAFQAANGLPQSGETDGPTWEALLALTPVAVQYPKPPPSTGPTGTTGTSGASGTSGSSGSSGGTGPSGGTPA
jgi:peptidoglycan hydrolase-like protein with peptidoglycan-binding domain